MGQGLQRSRQRDFHSRIPFSAFITEWIWALEDPQNSQMYIPCTRSQEESHRGETLPRKPGIQPRGEEPLGWNRERSGWQPHLANYRKTGAGSGFSLVSLFLSPLLSSQFTRKSDCNTSESIQSLTTFHFSCEHPGPSHHPDHCGLLAVLSASFLVLFLTEQLAWCDPFQVQVPWIGVICCDVDGPRVCHTEWSKSEREKQALYIHTYTWNPEKWYRGTYLQGGNRDSDIENPHVDVLRGSAGWDALGEEYTALRKKVATRSSAQGLCDALEAWEGRGGEVQEGGSVCADGWFISQCSRNYHNIVKQLHSNKNKQINKVQGPHCPTRLCEMLLPSISVLSPSPVLPSLTLLQLSAPSCCPHTPGILSITAIA